MARARPPKSKRRDRLGKLRGRAIILVTQNGKAIDKIVKKNIILYQGNAQVITTLATASPSTQPRVITRMAFGDQGALATNQTVPKVPTQGLEGLYHEVYRQDVNQPTTITINPGEAFSIPATLTANSAIVTVANTATLGSGMSVSGTYIPSGTIIEDILNSTQFEMSNPCSLSSGTIEEEIVLEGAVNQAQFVTTFESTAVPLSSFSNPSNPIMNEVGLVIINPSSTGGISRAPVAAPNANLSDEVVSSILTFNSVPFLAANDIAVTIRYTLFME